MKNRQENQKKYIRIAFIAFLCLVIFLNYLFVLAPERLKEDHSELQNNKTMPPSLTLITVALGPIRGLIADALWWHVAELQERSEFFEILKITDWITAMQPKNAFVWTYHAWNLAYNIAYEFPTAETRWEWIYNGIKLLRDEGLQLNPDNNFIKNELAWMFVDRVGGTSDVQCSYYIHKWSEIMGKYMKDGDRNEILKMIEVSNSDQKKFIADSMSRNNSETIDLVNRTNAMRKKMKLDPDRMLYIDKRYGPFNWLLPQATAIYWGARKHSSQHSQGYVNYKVVIPVAMQQSFLKGSIISDAESELFVTTNNLKIAPNIIKMYKAKAETSQKPHLEHAQCLMFLISAIPILYSFNEIEMASLLFDEYKRLRPEVKVDFRNFTITQLLRLQNKGAARYKQSLIEISLYNAYKALVSGQKDKAAKFAEAAENAWKKHQQKYGSGVLRLPALKKIKAAALCKACLYLDTPSEKETILKLANDKKSGALYIKNAKDLSYNGKKIQ
jgi:hypothetical protein